MLLARRSGLGEAGFKFALQVASRQQQEQHASDRALQAKQAAEARENAACSAALRAWQHAWRWPAQAPHLLLPSGRRRRLRALSAQRRKRHLQHLAQVIAAALATSPAGPAGLASPAAPSDSPTKPASNSALAGPLCAACGGGCCTRGGDQAYLTAETIQRFSATLPGLDADALLAAYAARLPQRSVAGSCIHHTAQGCSLPRLMRSDTCNRYACDALAALQQAAPIPAVIVIQRRQSHWDSNRPDLDNRISGVALVSADAPTVRRRPPSPITSPI